MTEIKFEDVKLQRIGKPYTTTEGKAGELVSFVITAKVNGVDYVSREYPVNDRQLESDTLPAYLHEVGLRDIKQQVERKPQAVAQVKAAKAVAKATGQVKPAV